jgi:DNA-binding PadR family transcriptional regulator
MPSDSPSSRLKEKITTDNLWLYILALLKERDMYGYELREAVEHNYGFKPGNVTAYRVLYALKRRDLVKTIEKKEGQKRKYYSITERGKAELKKGKQILKEVFEKL